MTENYSVYEHICPNGKRYIGITGRNPKIRWGKMELDIKPTINTFLMLYANMDGIT